uniref:Small ubiquitin-related modifier n=1 Tax=Dunaliella tertiolecta TaxID=3047 RepID=A0A7S3R9R7_DUNTE|mmetsp:Transcript_22687/g.62639  ORF Transcript_22687/g.62639 Transcript_22687/m.62639 type:complete len:101 (+) Transcript_22687:42-344(+)|eukprot:CAMPEP_0202351220 /NCGR_PEP_ID=MMETSP1126-20121109/7959_1 /ASSEMBLY_ACC=CAM_ASM_000457 /TAXON_ID=3047 /ORGANISM="Dunaliella tertiolecta, Strain CCMP1320" /LENGTH=100 /DNA_ID=CAMNT_0048943307 /DNA_START=32 /DNA_END=334 /DNA_ORIENTATION=+
MSEQQQEQASNVQPKAEGGIISLVVQDQNGTEVMFKVKPHTKLVKVMDAYIQKKNLDPSRIRFLFDGQRIMNDDTPEKMGIEDGDHIDCVQTQLGGASLL